MTPKICFTFPESSLTYQVESINREEAEVNLISVDSPMVSRRVGIQRSVDARQFLIKLHRELPGVANSLMKDLEDLLMEYEFGPEIKTHPSYQQQACKLTLPQLNIFKKERRPMTSLAFIQTLGLTLILNLPALVILALWMTNNH